MLDYFAIYRDIWKFHKTYISGVSNSDTYWNAVITAGDNLIQKYNYCDFVRALLANEINEFSKLLSQSIQPTA